MIGPNIQDTQQSIYDISQAAYSVQLPDGLGPNLKVEIFYTVERLMIYRN